MSTDPKFLYICCQHGAEPALKQEIGQRWPDLRLAFSRPGFVTYKRPDNCRLSPELDLKSVFARAVGWSYGTLRGESAEPLAEQFWEVVPENIAATDIHVCQRDSALPGDRGFEPGPTPLAATVGRLLSTHAPADRGDPLPINREVKGNRNVLDCILIEPNQWCVGWHRAASITARWPGGVPKIELPGHAVSRAYLKMEEAVRWSKMPLRDGDRCVEIGSSPGGSCQALLDRGQLVTGIDPAEMDDTVTEHPNFTHIRKRGADLKRREYASFRWLFADANVAPNHTLDTVEHIVTNDRVSIHGMLLTLKLSNWELAEQIPNFRERIQGWGYGYVKVRQLAFNRREICVAAFRDRATIRTSRIKKRKEVKEG